MLLGEPHKAAIAEMTNRFLLRLHEGYECDLRHVCPNISYGRLTRVVHSLPVWAVLQT